MAPGLSDFIIASGISLGLIMLSCAVFYEMIAHLWVRLPLLKKRPRTQIILSVLFIFMAHTIAIWLFAITYWLLDQQFHLGTLVGTGLDKDFFDYLYFSTVSYSSLGLGDIYPTGTLRLMMGVEGLLGLILIGWSVGFTYLVTQQYFTHRSGKDHPLLK